MKKLLWRILLVGLVGGASFVAWRQWKLANKSPVPEGIVFGNGRIESIRVDIAAKYGGRIKEVLAQEGDLVTEGQVVARMVTDELQAELAKDKSKLAESREAAHEV